MVFGHFIMGVLLAVVKRVERIFFFCKDTELIVFDSLNLYIWYCAIILSITSEIYFLITDLFISTGTV